MKDFGTFIDEIIESTAKEVDAPINVIMEALSTEYRVSVPDIRECLRLVGSKFTLNNNVVYWDHIDHKWVKRTNHLAKVTNAIKKIGHGLKELDDSLDIGEAYSYVEAVFTSSACFGEWTSSRTA